jgi:mediator of RNA polymerase II transcription subunit 12
VIGEESKPESNMNYKYWTYVTKLCEHMYHEGLLDRQEFLQWVYDMIERYRNPEDPIVRLLLPLLLQYANEFVKSELLSRKLAYQCAKKISVLVHDTEAVCNASGDVTSPTHPVMSAFLELMEDTMTRFLILGFSSVLQLITLNCPTALVWNYCGENKTPSSLVGSPLDLLPQCAPSGLPMPPRSINQSVRHRIKQAELVIKERSVAAEGKNREKIISEEPNLVCFSPSCS